MEHLQGEEFVENGHSFKILDDDDIVIQLFNVEGYMIIICDKKNRLWNFIK